MVGDVVDVPEVRSVAERHDVSPARVALAWLLEKGAVPIPRGDSVDHMRDNLAARSLSLDSTDVAALDDIDRRGRVYDNEAVWGDADGRASGE
jgi:diketogulonate reductase-like aldo/keto reductase